MFSPLVNRRKPVFCDALENVLRNRRKKRRRKYVDRLRFLSLGREEGGGQVLAPSNLQHLNFYFETASSLFSHGDLRRAGRGIPNRRNASDARQNVSEQFEPFRA